MLKLKKLSRDVFREVNIRQTCWAFVIGLTTVLTFWVPAYATQSAGPKRGSASIWRNVSGPKETVIIAGRTLHIPVNLPQYHHLVEGDTASVWFRFHIKPDGNLALGGEDDSLGDIWTYLLDFYIIEKPRALDDLATTKILLGTYGLPPPPRVRSKQGIFTVFHSEDNNVYIEDGSAPYLAFSCANKPGGYTGPWFPACQGYRRPWQGARLNYVFGKPFVAVSPTINACISAMLEDFSYPIVGRVDQ